MASVPMFASLVPRQCMHRYFHRLSIRKMSRLSVIKHSSCDNRWTSDPATEVTPWHSVLCANILQSHFHSSAIRNLACKNSDLTEAEFETLVSETLESLVEVLEELPEAGCCPDDFDMTFADGVLTLALGGSLGTYVINKQTPNKQIWLSSPISGPKRFDYRDKQWIYSRDNEGLHKLLERELSAALQTSIDLSQCAFYS